MSQQMFCRERRSWTAKEDQLLREAVQKEDPDNSNPSKWHAIAKHVPNRTNKDCRKRWFAKMASDVVKGGWAPDEDEKLVKGIERYGTRWSLVASVVQTRNSDQCAKRWTDTLNPAIDRTTWTSEADELLLRAVAEHGKVWTKIVKTYFPGRTGLSAKNRYNSITRFNSDLSRGSRQTRRKSSAGDIPHYTIARGPKTERGSPSSSSSSPESPSLSLPFASSSSSSSSSSSPFQNHAKPASYRFDATFSTNHNSHNHSWSSSSSVTSSSDDAGPPSFRSSPMTFADYVSESTNTAPSTPPTEAVAYGASAGAYADHHLTGAGGYSTSSASSSVSGAGAGGADSSQIVFASSSPPLPSSTMFKAYSNAGGADTSPYGGHHHSFTSQFGLGHHHHHHQHHQQHVSVAADGQDHFVFDGVVDPASTAAYKLPPSNEFSYVF